MTDKERAAFNAIVNAETDLYQRSFLDGLLKHNDRYKAPLFDRCATPALGRLWKMAHT